MKLRTFSYFCTDKPHRKVDMRIGVIIAMEKEFVRLRAILERPSAENRNGKEFVCGTIAGNDIIMLQCGMGKVNAAIGAVEMITGYRPDLVISSGVAGGADATMNIMDVVVATECAYHDVYCGNEQQYGQVMGMPPRFRCASNIFSSEGKTDNVNIHYGLVVTGDWFVDSREKMRVILDRFPEAKAVDMESCAIAQTCHIYNTPFCVMRIISDIPLKDTHAAGYYDFWNRLADNSFHITKELLEGIGERREEGW